MGLWRRGGERQGRVSQVPTGTLGLGGQGGVGET